MSFSRLSFLPVRRLSAVLVLLSCASFLAAQDSARDASSPGAAGFARALGLGLGADLVSWSIDRFALDSASSGVSPSSWSRNLRDGFRLDDGLSSSSALASPYLGGVAFNAARSNGFGFWSSSLFAASNGLARELFLEKDRPALEDVAVSAFGGTALGEGSYRLASALLDRPPAGGRGAARRVLAAVIDPAGAANHYLLGRPYPKDGPGRPGTLELRTETGLGFLGGDWPDLDHRAVGLLGFSLGYGDPYEDKDFFAPYEQFAFDLGFALNRGDPTMDIFGRALLYGRPVYPGGSVRGLAGVFQHFDCLENRVYKFVSNGVGPGVLFRFPFLEKSRAELELHAYGVVLGSSGTADGEADAGAYAGTEGAYGFGPGLAGKAALRLDCGGELLLGLGLHHYAFRPSGGGAEAASSLELSAELPCSERLSLGSSLTYYELWARPGTRGATGNGAKFYLLYRL